MSVRRVTFYFCVMFIISLSNASAATLTPEENDFAKILNQFRSQLGLPTLTIDPSLQASAESHTAWMSARDGLDHNGPAPEISCFDRMTAAGFLNSTYEGENIACGNGDPLTTFLQWADSPGHLENMLNPHFHFMGIARAGNSGQNCPYYWTNDFGSNTDGDLDPDPALTPDQIQKALSSLTNQ